MKPKKIYDNVVILDLKITEDEHVEQVGLCLFSIKTLKVVKKDLFILSNTPLSHICSFIKDEYLGENRILATYGVKAKTLFEIECEDNGVDLPFNPDRWVNIRVLFPIIFASQKEVSLVSLLEYFKLSFEGNDTNACDQACNIGKAFAEIIRGQ